MLTLTNLKAFYSESQILNGIDLTLEPKAITCLIGRNGVGKSTTLKAIMGLIKTTGSIVFEEKDITAMTTYNRARLGISYVPQGRDIFPQMTVEENLTLALQNKSKKIPEYIYELFPILPKFAKRNGGDLSGGQQQQLAIARALSAEPKVLILDEPTEGIQPNIIEDIGEVIRKVNETLGIAVLIVEQYLDFVLAISKNLYVMEKGSIVLSGDTKTIDRGEVQRILTE
jgi:urea transport system ATP-binding protein